MPFIQNVSRADIISGNHKTSKKPLVCISITDPAGTPPKIKHPFDVIHRFEFLDVDDNDAPGALEDPDAQRLVDILQQALKDDHDVIVHCHMGICRSGAVAEVGELMGFDVFTNFRNTNLVVKRKMMQILDLTYKQE